MAGKGKGGRGRDRGRRCSYWGGLSGIPPSRYVGCQVTNRGTGRSAKGGGPTRNAARTAAERNLAAGKGK